jgi:hypothetical protein
VSNNTIFNYARVAAQAEQRLLELLDGALRDDLAEEDSSEVDLRSNAQPRQGQDSSG